MKDILDPLTEIAGVRLAALISHDGVPIALVGEDQPGQADTDEAFRDFQAFAAVAAGWLNDVQRATAPLSWASPQRLVLSGTRGALVMCAGPGAVLLVVLEHGVSPEDLKVPMDGVVARMQRKLRNMGPGRDVRGVDPEQNVRPVPAAAGPDPSHPQSILPTREDVSGAPQSPQSPSPQ